ncbi:MULTISPECIES: hypothetical protein [Henriciella]|jgi:hypothetical protein|uniref:DUF2382 domain-containing protein n=1 Tax=Henriciella pelagia TaxID=1977912 RepID=A0ABQ1JPP4_9PROT|nr:hypothetical protein [Henriciella pelagia]GGB71684.1 hypothetical protein GCM10011503_20460 [Henriciella pelagia]
MKLTSKLLVSVVALSALPIVAHADGDKSWTGQAVGDRYTSSGSETGERVLTDAEIRDIISRSGASGPADVRYMGGSETAIETNLCCENVEERVTEQTEVEETTTYFDAVTRREITQPVERTLIQPIERRIVRGRTEEVTEPTRYEEERLPVIIEQDDVPAIVENVTEDVTVENVEEATETYYDVITRREITQPVERTTVVPVQRRITRPRTETVTAETRYETVRAPVRIEEQPVPAIVENITEQVNEVTRDEVTETYVDAVTRRDVYQPVVKTMVQPIERRILRGTTETVTNPTRYEEERLPVRVETSPAPQVVEEIIPQVTERTVLEVEDVYIDQVTRNVIQPVVITTIQPVERRVLRAQTERVTAPTRYEEERLPVRVEADPIPETQINYIPQVSTQSREEVTESYFEAVTQRNVIQPVVRKIIQPVEYRRVRAQTERVTAPTRYETQRASLVVLNVGGGCNCN